MGNAFLYGNGSTAALNFRIIGGITQPQNPRENDIWVNTDVLIPGWTLCDIVSKADYSVSGSVAIEYNSSNQNDGFNALKRNGIYLILQGVYQSDGAGWVDKEAQIYQNGQWNPISYVLFPADISGFTIAKAGPNPSGSTYDLSIDDNGYLKFAVTGPDGSNSAYGAVYTKNKIDLTKYKTVRIVASSDYVAGAFGVSSINADGNPPDGGGVVARKVIGNTPEFTTYELDISSLSGPYYLYFNQASFTNTTHSISIKAWNLIP